MYQDHAEGQLRHHGEPADPEGVDYGEARASPAKAEEIARRRAARATAGTASPATAAAKGYEIRYPPVGPRRTPSLSENSAKTGTRPPAGALSGDDVKRSEGRSGQRRGTMKEKRDHLKDLFKQPG